MVVYLDLLFLFNFCINAIFLYVIELIYSEKISLKRIFLGGFIGGLLIFGFFFDYYLYFFLKVIGGIIISLTGFRNNNVFKTIIKITSFYILNFASVGLVSSFNIAEWYLLLFSIAILILIFFIENNKKPYIFINKLKYNVSVSFNTKRLNLEGYLDTGNFSKCDDLPIIYLSKKYQSNDDFYKMISISTINGITCSKAYKPTSFSIVIDKVKINRDVLIVYANIKDFDCLLNSELFY